MEKAASIFTDLTVTPLEIFIALGLGVAAYTAMRTIVWLKPLRKSKAVEKETMKFLGDLRNLPPLSPPSPREWGRSRELDKKRSPYGKNFSPISGCYVSPKPKDRKDETDKLDQRKLEIMAKNPVGMMVPISEEKVEKLVATVDEDFINELRSL